MNKRRILFLLSILLFSMLRPNNVNADILLEVKVGDSWTYAETNDIQYNKYELRSIEYINYTANNREYYPISGNEYVPTNNVTQSKYINLMDDLFNNTTIYFYENNDIKAFSRFIMANTQNIKNYYTARGSFNFMREIIYDGVINSSLYNSSVIIESSHVITNIESVKTLIDGNAYTSDEMFILNINKNINETHSFLLHFYYSIKLLFTSSDKFTYNGRECRNMTIQTIKHVNNVIHIQLLNKINSSESIVYETNSTFIFERNEKWVYSYDIGIPLFIQQYYGSEITAQKELKSIYVNRLLSLTDYSIQNAKKETTTRNTPTDIIPLMTVPIAAVTLIITSKLRKRRLYFW